MKRLDRAFDSTCDAKVAREAKICAAKIKSLDIVIGVHALLMTSARSSCAVNDISVYVRLDTSPHVIGFRKIEHADGGSAELTLRVITLSGFIAEIYATSLLDSIITL